MEKDPISVLLIEDETDLRETLAELLEERGYLVKMVASGSDAVDLAKTSQFDVVVTDIRTDGQVDGLSALEKVKESQPDVSGVVITGYSTEDYALRAVKLQVEDYLKKPFQLNTFLQRIESIANQKRKSKKEAQERSKSRAMILWFTSQIAQGSTVGSQLDLDQYEQIVSSLTQKLSLGQEVADGLKIASSLAFAQETSALEIPELVQESLPISVVDIMLHRHGSWSPSDDPKELTGDSLPLGSRVVKLALELASQQKSVDAEALKASGEYDPELVSLYESESIPKPNIGDARSLLAVGLALEDAGDFEQALETFRILAQDYPGTRSEVFAALGRARLNRSRGNLDIAKQAALRAFELSKRQGPGLAALCGLQAGILLSRQGDKQGKTILLDASRRLSQIRDAGGRSVCVLALAHFWGEEGPVDVAARTLVASEFTPDFIAAASWLTNFFLTTNLLDPKLDELLLAKAAQDCPSWMIEACQDSNLDEKARVRAIEALSTSLPPNQLEPILKGLQKEESVLLRQAALEAAEKSGNQKQSIPTLRLSALGGFRLYRGEQRLESDIRRRKPKFFLAYLMSLGERSHSDESLIEVFWPGDPEKGRSSLRAALSYLRRQLQPAGSKEEVNYFLKPAGQVKLNPDFPVWYDLRELEVALRKFRKLRSSKQVDQAVSAARQAAKLYEGPFLDDCYMDWAIEIRARLEAGVSESLQFLMEWCASTQKGDQGVEFAQKLLAIDPAVESAHQYLMQTYLDQGRSAEVLKQYERCERALRKELDVEPATETLKLKLQASQ